jgi:Mrp family chromosome partitioning ATPase
MRRLTAVITAAVLVTTTLALAGCTTWFESPAKPANAAIAVANGHLKAAATIESQVASSSASLQTLPYSRKGARKALTITAALKDSLKSERTELLAAKAAMDGIPKLDVSDTFKKYATLESEAIDARVALVDADSRLYDVMDRLYTAQTKTKNNLDAQETVTAIQQMQEEVSALTETASKASQAASDYFTTNKLGG